MRRGYDIANEEAAEDELRSIMEETSTYEWRYASEDEGVACDRCGSMAPTAEVADEMLCRFCNETYLGAILAAKPAAAGPDRMLVRGLLQAFNLLDNSATQEIPF